MFELVPSLAKKDHIIDLKLCSVLFEDNAYYPWIFLVPRVENAKNMTKLSLEERLQLMREMDLCEEVMVENFPCDQTNIAMIGNKTPQLHVHILCRKEGDPDWPTTVWNNHSKHDEKEQKDEVMAKRKKARKKKEKDEKKMREEDGEKKKF